MICDGLKISEALSSRVITLALVTMLCSLTGCFESPLVCASSSDCFVGERCNAAGVCENTTLPVTPDMNPDLVIAEDLSGRDSGGKDLQDMFMPCDPEACAQQGLVCDPVTQLCTKGEIECREDVECEDGSICQDGRCVMLPPPPEFATFQSTSGDEELFWTLWESRQSGLQLPTYIATSTAFAVYPNEPIELDATFSAQLVSGDVLDCEYGFYMCQAPDNEGELFMLENSCQQAAQEFSSVQDVDEFGVQLVEMDVIGALSVRLKAQNLPAQEPFVGALFFVQSCKQENQQPFGDDVLSEMRLELNVRSALSAEALLKRYNLSF